MERCLAQAGGSLRPVITEKEALSLTTDILDGLAGLSPHTCARPLPPLPPTSRYPPRLPQHRGWA